MKWDMIYDAWGEFGDLRFVDLKGNPVKKTPFTDPYGYNEFVIWQSDDFDITECDLVHSDRMMSWNIEHFNKCCQEAFSNLGQTFSNRSPQEVHKFLNLYMCQPVRLTAITQCCNQATGFPYWTFYYKEV